VTKVSVAGLGNVIEGEFRPGFFDGVATVVTKLLLQAMPDVAFFGEKDYQQLNVIKRFVADLNIPCKIEGVPTVRETDGLALSSRNAYLNEAERQTAPRLHLVLTEISKRFDAGESATELSEWAASCLLDVGFHKVDYVLFKKADDLMSEAVLGLPKRVLVAAYLGKARLIDNVS